MSVKSRSDMMIKTNMIQFPHWGVRLTPNPSKCDLSCITQEQSAPKGPGPWPVPAKSCNLIYKGKSGSVFLPGRTFVYHRGVTLSHCLPDRGLQQLPLCRPLRGRKHEEEEKRARCEREQGEGWTYTTYTIDILWPSSQADNLHGWFYFTQP